MVRESTRAPSWRSRGARGVVPVGPACGAPHPQVVVDSYSGAQLRLSLRGCTPALLGREAQPAGEEPAACPARPASDRGWRALASSIRRTTDAPTRADTEAEGEGEQRTARVTPCRAPGGLGGPRREGGPLDQRVGHRRVDHADELVGGRGDRLHPGDDGVDAGELDVHAGHVSLTPRRIGRSRR